MDHVASQPRDRAFERNTGHDHDSWYDTSTGWFQVADSRVIKISCEDFLQNRAYINKFKLRMAFILPFWTYGTLWIVFPLIVVNEFFTDI